MIAAVAYALASIDPSTIDGSMLSVAPSAGELFHFVIDSLPIDGTLLHFDKDDVLPSIAYIESRWVPEHGNTAGDAYVGLFRPQSAVVGPASDGFPPAIDWVAFAARALGAFVASLLCWAYFRWQDMRALAVSPEASPDALWWAEHRERLQWVRSMIMLGHPHRALYELEHALEDL